MSRIVSGLLMCPVCNERLVSDSKTYRCRSGHSFDCASSGYVNLLPPSAGKVHGDNGEMIAARNRFLEAGYYAPLREAVTAAALKSGAKVILDAGCGECYYTCAVGKALPDAGIIGIDMSKCALRYGARREGMEGAALAVASVYRLPVPDAECSLVMSVFSPFAREEFLRVTADGGTLISVIPTERHLFGLKKLLYDKPYENALSQREVEGFELVGCERIEYNVVINGNGLIRDLFTMTPYRYRTGGADTKLSDVQELPTEVGFEVLTYRKAAKS